MKQFIKPGIVLAGYIIAFLLASEAVAIRIANTSGPDADASAGMYAFGDGLLFLAVFGTAALLPTGLAMVFAARACYRLTKAANRGHSR